VAQHAHLHRHDIQLLTDLLADFDPGCTARTAPLGFGNLVDHLDARQFGRKRLALTVAAGRRRGRLGVSTRRGQFDGLARLGRLGRFSFGLVEQPRLPRVRFATLAELAQTGQPDLFVKL